MPNKAKVVPINSPARNIRPQTAATRRYIIAIGQQRICFEMTCRMLELPPGTDDHAPITAITESAKKRNT